MIKILLVSLLFVGCGYKINTIDDYAVVKTIVSYKIGRCSYEIGQGYSAFLNSDVIIDSCNKFEIGDTLRLKPVYKVSQVQPTTAEAINTAGKVKE